MKIPITKLKIMMVPKMVVCSQLSILNIIGAFPNGAGRYLFWKFWLFDLFKGYMYWKEAFIPLAIVSLPQRAESGYITGKIKCKQVHQGAKFALNNLIANYYSCHHNCINISFIYLQLGEWGWIHFTTYWSKKTN